MYDVGLTDGFKLPWEVIVLLLICGWCVHIAVGTELSSNSKHELHYTMGYVVCIYENVWSP